MRRSVRACGFYTITSHDRLTWPQFSERHAAMLMRMRKAAERGHIPKHAGVRVFEEGEQTKRPHAHWVMTPRMSQAVVQRYATQAALGFVWLDLRFAGGPLAKYLTKYLSKAKLRMGGLRQWSTFGDYEGVKCADILIQSPAVESFRAHRLQGIAQGMTPTQAFAYARLRANLARYGEFADTMQAAAPVVPPYDGPTEEYWDIKELDNDGEPDTVDHDETR